MENQASDTLNFTSLQQAIEYFSDPEKAHAVAVSIRWPNGVCCPRCGDTDVTYLAKYFRWQCKGCGGKQFTVKVGTLMEDSPLPLKKWMAAVWLITNAKNGVSSCEVSRALGVTQKTAWYLLHRIRLAMHYGTMEKMSGTVEADEMYVGGLERNKHESKKQKLGGGGVGKQIVMGILQRATEEKPSQVRAKVIRNAKAYVLAAELRANVEKGSKLMTDAHGGYRGLSSDLEHEWIDHKIKYAEGQVHTNGLENFWSLFSRMLHGTYTHIDPQHLNAYVDEQADRFNNRTGTDLSRFKTTMRGMEGKRLTYTDLKSRTI